MIYLEKAVLGPVTELLCFTSSDDVLAIGYFRLATSMLKLTTDNTDVDNVCLKN
jgi:hypothetical protein